LSLLALVLLLALPARAAPPRPAKIPDVTREVAVTFDDLPGVSVARSDPGGSPGASLAAMTARLIAILKAERVPAVVFSNEGKLGRSGAPAADRVALLRAWRDAKIELGNHTADHRDFHRVGLAAFQGDVVAGEPVVRSLLAERGMRLRWFRHPFLHTGTTLDDKRALEAFLARRGYRIAPVTIDNSEWIFARAYADALDRGDRALAGKVASAYVPYMEAKLDYFERQSIELFGREIRQVLLVHANSLNADHFGGIVGMMRRRGYAFITLDRALADPAYATPDTFVGRGGITWLHRWAISTGRGVLPDEPRTPPFVLAAASVTEE
jgi:peptidoglycan/xylan/chitin deacetylase (PgdA/CDA1 family)